MNCRQRSGGCGVIKMLQHTMLSIAILFFVSVETKAQRDTPSIRWNIVRVDTLKINKSLPQLIAKLMTTDSSGSPLTRVELYLGHNHKPFQIIVDTLNGFGDVGYADINIDGYTDLRFDDALASVNTTSYFMLYNPATHKYESSLKFRNFSNVELNTKDSTICSEDASGDIYRYSIMCYKVINHQPVLISLEEHAGDRYSYEIFLSDRIIETEKGTWEQKRDSAGQEYISTSKYQYLFDTLRLVEKINKRHVGGNVPSGAGRKYYETTQNGTFMLLSRETFTYELNENKQIVRESLLQEVRDGELDVISDTTEIMK
jgi:hypothetical protein